MQRNIYDKRQKKVKDDRSNAHRGKGRPRKREGWGYGKHSADEKMNDDFQGQKDQQRGQKGGKGLV